MSDRAKHNVQNCDSYMLLLIIDSINLQDQSILCFNAANFARYDPVFMDSCCLHLGKLNYNYRIRMPTERNTQFRLQ
jgi:hypothetical protein